MATAAPVLNKVVTSPPAKAPEADAAQVSAAIHFGAALQELVARVRLRPDGPSGGSSEEPQISGPRFPEDLSHRRKPADALRAAFRKLRKLEREVLRGTEDRASSPIEVEDAMRADAPHPHHYAPYLGDRRDRNRPEADVEENGHDGPAPSASPSGRIAEKIERLLEAYRRDKSLGNLYEHLSGEGGLDELILEWDAYVVERTAVSAPRVLAGYKVGKALGRTRWSIRCARYENTEDGDPRSGAWNAAFGARRVGEMQRQINALNDVLDPAALTMVATSLGYWRNSLLSLPDIAAGTGRRPEPAARKAIAIPAGKDGELEEALEKQLDDWLDLITGRRRPESFPVAGIVSTLTKNLVASRWARSLGVIVPVVAGLGILAVLAVVVLSGATTLGITPAGGDGDPVAGLLSGLGAAVLAFLGIRGRSFLLDRGAGDVDGLKGRIDALGGMLGGMLDGRASGRTTPAVGPQHVSWQGLKDDVLSQLVAQIRLEELNIAVSKPLVDFVLALNDDGTDDPMEDARRFLRLAYGNRSNLDRLLPVFQSLYKHFRTAPPA